MTEKSNTDTIPSGVVVLVLVLAFILLLSGVLYSLSAVGTI
ncbi:hypothetical protein Ple7327_4459 [Pleurocapsa sp. PCC 7327]|nr:hypothetical protein [Pleurocapsa sp. PCC 7327]AFY79562.1 hypothetical protein Ple7327_4459 [Pleurocapsa sp. PCC 7327]